MRRTRVLPSARRLMLSLRDLGYDLPEAIAELVDNSIDAHATEVRIDLRFKGADSWIRVADNGDGMSPRQLDEAMRFGATGDYDAQSLGGFGLGLKTASLSQCRVLSVASRVEGTVETPIRRWDLGYVDGADDWSLEHLVADEAPDQLLEPLISGAGTVVLWQALDRIMLYRNPDGLHAEAALHQAHIDLIQHLAMVYHRFLSGEARRTLPLTIWVNDEIVEPWDPFARAEPHGRALPPQTLHLTQGDATLEVAVRAFILPSQHQFSSAEAHRVAGGPKKWNRQQGLYIYRRDRLIQSGGWNRLRTQDEHTKLARVSLDIPTTADEAFGINISKMRVVLPAELRPHLRALVAGIAGRAQETYRSRSSRRGAGSAPSEPAAPGPMSILLPESDFIPRAVAVRVLRAHLGDQPALLRRVVNAVLAEEWAGLVAPETIDGAASAPAEPEMRAPVNGAAHNVSL